VTRVRGLLDAIVADPANGVDRLWTREDLHASERRQKRASR
jgi:hypothetical protein